MVDLHERNSASEYGVRLFSSVQQWSEWTMMMVMASLR
jgi:hypothetical protein